MRIFAEAAGSVCLGARLGNQGNKTLQVEQLGKPVAYPRTGPVQIGVGGDHRNTTTQGGAQKSSHRRGRIDAAQRLEQERVMGNYHIGADFHGLVNETGGGVEADQHR
jgi:hypothetical protein